MHNDLLIAIALVINLGLLAQWVSWRFHVPSIVLLLVIGLLVGPIADMTLGEPVLDVEHFLGELLFPVVSASVAIILFEGGLSLRLSDIRGSGQVVGKLVTVGVLISWSTGALAAYLLLDLPGNVAILLGSVLVVTGPTVIIPLLAQIRPKGRVNSILRWEGIIIDPVGAILAVLVFEEVISGPSIDNTIVSLFLTIAIGFSIGWVSARSLVFVFKRYWVPEKYQNPVTLGVLVAAFTLSNVLQSETGLLTVTLMGIIMANQDEFDISPIVEFKETLQILLLSSLFILLSARMQPDDLRQIGLPVLAFVAFMIFIQRPLVVYFSTFQSDLSWQERVFLTWMAPRGIVAAAVASIFSLELVEHGAEGAELIVPVTFAVIIGTVVIYSLTAGMLARRLGLAEIDPQGLLIVGAARWIREIAHEVQDIGFRVLLVDSNRGLVRRARNEGLEVYHGNILSERVLDEINLGGIGRLLAMTPNAEVNALAAEHFESTFGSSAVYELPRPVAQDERTQISQHLGGRPLFAATATYDEIMERYQHGARIAVVKIDDPREAESNIPGIILPLFSLDSAGKLLVWSIDDPPRVQAGQLILALVEKGYYTELVDSQAISPQGSKMFTDARNE